jgi:hypothetical protein
MLRALVNVRCAADGTQLGKRRSQTAHPSAGIGKHSKVERDIQRE